MPVVREQWEQCRRLEAEINDLFPASGSTSPGEAGRPVPAGVGLPRVPGYGVEAVLGRGGMGIVYQARHLRLNRTVALKMLLSGEYASPVERARFLREARAVAALRHANIVQVYDVGEFDGRPYFTMELVAGGTLARSLAGVPQPAARAAAVLATLSGAMESAHRGGIVHRDLKPSNVLLTAEGTPKISDFGLARRVDGEDPLTLTGGRVGTPSYMAPEQVYGRAGTVGPAADVYALGAVLYEMLTGPAAVPGRVGGRDRAATAGRGPGPAVPAERAGAPRPGDDLPQVPAEGPARRYAAAAALADDLRRFERGEPVLARQTGRAERAVKWVRRRPAAATALAAAAVLLLSLVGGTLWVVLTRAATAKAVEEDLAEAAGRQRQSDWVQADAALDRATLRLGGHGPGRLRRQLDQARRDSRLAARLDVIRLAYIVTVGGVMNVARADEDYAEAFRAAGLGTDRDDPRAVAERVKASNIRARLVAALDDWCTVAFSPRQSLRRRWIVEVARRADGDPTGWRTVPAPPGRGTTA